VPGNFFRANAFVPFSLLREEGAKKGLPETFSGHKKKKKKTRWCD
jgi:hypothetical protein